MYRQTCVTLPGSTWRAPSQSGGSGVARWATSRSETATSTPGSESWGIPCWCRPSEIRKETKERKRDVTHSNRWVHNLHLLTWKTSIQKARQSFIRSDESDESYLTGRHQVEGVEQEETEALNEEHVVAVFPQQEEGNTGGTHGEIAKHLQRGEKRSLRGEPRKITAGDDSARPQGGGPRWRSLCCYSGTPSGRRPGTRSKAEPSGPSEEWRGLLW